MIEPSWPTARLTITDSQASDLEELQRILESNAETLALEGRSKLDDDEMVRIFHYGDLPPGGRKESFRLQTIRRTNDGEITGYLVLYHGYPTPDCLYIVSLVLDPNCQGQGFGGEIVSAMPSLEGLKDYRTHRLVVTVRNWNAVRFWFRQGFTNITGVHGNLRHGDGSSARLELSKST